MQEGRTEPRAPRRSWVKTLVGLAVLGVAIAVVTSGVHDDLSVEGIRGRLLAAGPWGAVGYVLAFALLQPMGVAAHVFVISAGLVWPPAMAITLSWVGAVSAGCSAFVFARFIAHDWVQARLSDRLRRYDERLARHGFRTVVVLRLLFFTFGPVQLMLGVSRVRFLPFVLGTAVGVVPLVVAETLLGAGLLDWVLSARG